jgi:hypothetical protein
VVQIHPPLLLYKVYYKNLYIESMFKDVGRETFGIPPPRVLLLLFIQAFRGKLGLEEGEPGHLAGRTRWVCKGLEEGRASSYNIWNFAMGVKVLMIKTTSKLREIAGAFRRFRTSYGL